MERFKKLIILIVLIIWYGSSAMGALNVTNNLLNSSLVEYSILAPMASSAIGATISGTTTACQNDTTLITFSASGGVSPYVFTYKVNNGSTLTCITDSKNSSVTVPAPNSVAGIFAYTLVSVSDATGTSQSVTGTATLTVNEQPNANLFGTGSGDTFNGIPVFKNCANSVNTFTFTNASSTKSANASYRIQWGDGTSDMTATSWASTSHTYSLGAWDLTYTVVGKNGCTTVKKYQVFVGSSPKIAIDATATINTNICTTELLTIPLSGISNNPPGTMYTVTYNDGSQPEVYYQPGPTQITHRFTKSSCGVSSTYGGKNYANAYLATIVASNPCGVTSVNVAPIYVSTPPSAHCLVSAIKNCVNTPVTFTDTSDGVEIAISGSTATCNTNMKTVWTISPSTGYTLSNGTLGSDNSSADQTLWTAGSTSINPVFSTPGTYIVKMKTSNRCGTDETQTVICVEPKVLPTFTVSAEKGCAPLTVVTNNKTDVSKACSTPEYNWTVTYTASNCGTVSDYTTTNGTLTSASPTFEFKNPGTYVLTMSTKTACGTDAVSQVVTVSKPPTVSIDSIYDVCGPQKISPTASITTCNSTDSTVLYAWSFPGGIPATSNKKIPGAVEYTTPGTYTVSLAITNECGVTTANTKSFKVNKVPVVTNTSLSQTICSGQTTNSVILTADAPATTFSWTANGSGGLTGFSASGTGDIPVQTIINSSAVAGNVTYTILPKLGNCTGLPVNYVVTVNPVPQISTLPASGSFCKDGSVSPLKIAVANALGTPTYQWYSNVTNDTIAATALAGEITDTYTPKSTAVGTMYYYCVINCSQNCSVLRSNIAMVTVNPTPVISAKSAMIFSGGTFTVTPTNTGSDIVPTGTTYTWGDPVVNPANSVSGVTAQPVGQPSISQLLNNKGATASTVTYTVTPTSGSCSGASFDVVVTVSPQIVVNVVTDSITCNGANNGAFKTTISGGNPPYNFSWTGPNGFTATTADISGLAPGNYKLTVSDINASPSTLNYTLTEPTAFTMQTVLAKNVTCFGASDGQITLKAAGGTLPYTYNWKKDNVAFSTNQNLVNLGPGVYEVSVSDKYSCNIQTTLYTITEAPAMTLNLVSKTDNKCAGDSLGSIDINVTGGRLFQVAPGVQDYHYLWTGPKGFKSTNQNLSNLVAGKYDLAVSDSSGCSKNLSVNITEPTPIKITSITTPITCQGADNATISLTVTGGTAPYSINWSNGKTGLSQDSLAAGTYVITVTDSVNCQSQISVVIAAVQALVINPVVKNVSCNGMNNGSINLNLSGGTSFLTVSWDDNGTSATTRTNLAPGNYTVRIYSGTPCAFTRTFTITEPQPLTLNLVSKTDNKCFGDALGSITVNTAGGTLVDVAPGVKDYLYSWTGPKGFKSTTQNLSNISAGQYTLVVSDSANCTQSLSVTITEPTQIKITPVTTPITCLGADNATINISISGGTAPYTTSWNNGSTGLSLDSLAAGDYVITVTDSTSCQSVLHVNIPEALALVINPVVKNVSCNGMNNGSINLNMSGGTSFLTVTWDDNGSTATTRTNLIPGTYTARIYTGTPCAFSRTFTITEPQPLTLNLVSKTDNVCFGDALGSITVAAAGGTPVDIVPGVKGYLYSWTGPKGFKSTTQNLSNISAGQYTLVVSDSANCTQNLSVTITEPTQIKITPVTTPITCLGANNATINISVSGGTAPYTTSWSNGSTGLSLDSLAAGDYVVTVTDSANCQSVLHVNIPEAQPLIINPVVKNVSCNGMNDGSINLNLSGGTSFLTVTWDDNGSSATTRTNLAPGTYSVKIYSGTPCFFTRTFTITQPQPLALAPTVLNAYDCVMPNSGSVNLVVSGGTAPFTYLWSNGKKTKDLSNITAGNYVVTVTDSAGCTASAQCTILRQQPLALSYTSALEFDCTTKNIKEVYQAKVTGGIPPYKINWTEDTSSKVNGDVMVPTQNGGVILSVLDSIGCSTSLSFNVNTPSLGVDYTILDCDNRVVKFDASVPKGLPGTYTYSWDFGDGTTANTETAQHTYTASGSYNVQLNITCPTCNASYSSRVVVGQAPVLVLSAEPKLCINDSLVIHVSGAASYKWNDNSIADSLVLKKAGEYSVIGTSLAGCTSVMKFNATYFDGYNYSISTDRNEVASDGVALHLWSQDIPGSTYSWDFGDGDKANGVDVQHVYSVSKDGFFNVKLSVVNPNGCTETATKRIWNTAVALPNTFTPNGDSKNDIFLAGWHIKVYNRNGVLMYDGRDGWDGKYKGKEVAPDTYYFLMYYSTEKGLKSTTGYVTLIR